MLVMAFLGRLTALSAVYLVLGVEMRLLSVQTTIVFELDSLASLGIGLVVCPLSASVCKSASSYMLKTQVRLTAKLQFTVLGPREPVESDLQQLLDPTGCTYPPNSGELCPVRPYAHTGNFSGEKRSHRSCRSFGS